MESESDAPEKRGIKIFITIFTFMAIGLETSPFAKNPDTQNFVRSLYFVFIAILLQQQ